MFIFFQAFNQIAGGEGHRGPRCSTTVLCAGIPVLSVQQPSFRESVHLRPDDVLSAPTAPRRHNRSAVPGDLQEISKSEAMVLTVLANGWMYAEAMELFYFANGHRRRG